MPAIPSVSIVPIILVSNWYGSYTDSRILATNYLMNYNLPYTIILHNFSTNMLCTLSYV